MIKTLCATAGALLLAATAGASTGPAPALPADELAPVLEQEGASNPPVHGTALSSALQQRLDRRFAEAHAAVRPKWYQAAKIEALPPVGDGAVRVYRIVTGVVTYCMTYRQDGRGPTYSLCD